MKKLLVLLSILAMRQIHGQTFVTIPDANFASYLQSIIPSAMSGNQLNTSSSLVTTTTHKISVQNMNIHDLNGVQYFSSLTYLQCSGNFLTSLPTLPSTLDTLNCYTNLLTSLPTLPNSLMVLACETNSLTTLPTLPNSLVYLNCYTNSLTTLPALPNSLTVLICSDNQITCFPTFPNSINSIFIDTNPYNCLPNHIASMSTADLATPLCAAGNSNGCPVANSIEQFQSNLQVTVYPNPTSDQFYIETNATVKLTADLYDVNGRHVFNASVSDKSTINVATLDNGAYALTIKTADRVINKKIVIVH